MAIKNGLVTAQSQNTGAAGDLPVDAGSTGLVQTIVDTSSVGTVGDFTNQDINGLLSGSAWNGATITYSFPTTSDDYGTSATYSDPAAFNGFQVLTSAQQAVVRYALGLISSYTLLSFSEITETTSTHAMIRTAASASPPTSYAYYPSASGTGGDVWYGNIRNDPPNRGSYAFYSIMHELGHSVGLKHGQDDDGVHGVLPTAHNSTSWSVMDYHSYIGGDSFYDNIAGSGPQTYMIDDIAALQYMYGANFNNTPAGAVYTWSPTTGEEFINGVGQGAPVTNTIYEAIWDGGGKGVYDLSNYSTNLSLDLRPGEWSTFSSSQLADLDSAAPGNHLAPGNIANADEYNGNAQSLIVSADGGSGNDTIIGNAADNILRGGAGNDYIDGGGGTNTAVFSGTKSQYSLTNNGTNYTIVGPDGTDTLVNIQLLQFNDGTVGIGSLVKNCFSVTDTTSKLASVSAGTAYVGPVSGLDHQYINVTADSLNITTAAPNCFIHSGSGSDAIDVSKAGGTNVIDGSTGSNFLTGGSGSDTFFVDDRGPAADTWSTLVGFHSGDNATLWGVTPTDFTMTELDNQGAVGSTGLTLSFQGAGKPTAIVTLAGFTVADLTNGRLAVSYGTTADTAGIPGSSYMQIHGV